MSRWARAVREAFLRLYREGLAYRTEALIHWCPGCRTSVSDLEVIPIETTGSLWTMRYHLVDEATGAFTLYDKRTGRGAGSMIFIGDTMPSSM